MSGMQLRKYFVLTLKDEGEWEKGGGTYDGESQGT